MVQDLSVGGPIPNVDEAVVARVLHFVLDVYKPVCRPAIVVNDWPGVGRTGFVNLVVFPDGSNDGVTGHTHDLPDLVGGGHTRISEFIYTPIWVTSVLPNHAVRAVRSWHWPRECKALIEPAPPYFHEFSKKYFYHTHAADMTDEHNCYACSVQRTTEAK